MSKDKQPRKQVTVKPKTWDSTFQMLSWWKSETIKGAKVMVVGAGALGNEVLKNLTLLNIGHILIVDFDIIEYSNLSRSVLFREKDSEERALKAAIAADRIREINSNVKVQYINGDITLDVGLGVFRRMDVIIGCLDNRLARLFLNRACYKVGKTWVDGAIENLAGQVNVYKPFETCYECSLKEADWKTIRAKLGCADIAKRNFSQGRIPTTPISSSIVAAIQTQEALKVVNENSSNLMLESFYYEGMNNLILQLEPEALKEGCESHYVYEDIIESPLSNSNSVKELLDWLEGYFNDKDLYVKLDYDIALRVVGSKSDIAYNIIFPKLKLTEEKTKKYQKIADEAIVITNETNELDRTFPYLEKSLKEIGIPFLQILTIYSNSKGESYFVELTGDIKKMIFNL